MPLHNSLARDTPSVASSHSVAAPLVWLTRLCVLLFPSLLMLIPSGGSIIFGITVLLALITWLQDRRRVGILPVEKTYHRIIVVFFLYAIASHLTTGMTDPGESKLTRFLHLLMVLPFIALFIRTRLSAHWIWMGVLIGAIVAGLISSYDWSITAPVDGFYYRYEGGAINPIRFGVLAMILAALCMTALLGIKSPPPLLLGSILIAALLGLAAVLASGTRGAWLIAPFYLLTAMILLRKRVPQTLQVSLLATALLVPLLLYSIPQTQIAKRIDQAQTDWQAYFSQQQDIREGNIRLEMARASLMMFREAPVFGIGLGNFRTTADAYSQQNLAHPLLAQFRNPHNTYLTMLATLGIVGLLLMLIILIGPAAIAWHHRRSLTRQQLAYAFAIVFIVVGYLVAMLTNDMLDVKSSTIFFVMMIAQFLYLMLHPVETSPHLD